MHQEQESQGVLQGKKQLMVVSLSWARLYMFSSFQHQNEMIDRFKEVDEVVDRLQKGQTYGAIRPGDEESQTRPFTDDPSKPLLNGKKQNQEKSPAWVVRLAINLSMVANIVLFASKLFVAFFSGSMAILASAFESFLDLLSNAIIFFTIRIMRQKDYYTYPVGKVMNNAWEG